MEVAALYQVVSSVGVSFPPRPLLSFFITTVWFDVLVTDSLFLIILLGWISETNNSVHIDFLETRDVNAAAYCHVFVDSKGFKTGAASTWSAGSKASHFEFDLLSTTQYIQVYVKQGPRVRVGYILIPIADILANEKKELTGWFELWPMPDKHFDFDAHGQSGAADPCGTLRLTVSLSVSPAQPADASQVIKVQKTPFPSWTNSVRQKVSKKKNRWAQDGFDLDLTYVTPNLIAMGFPSVGVEGQYRNHLQQVQAFFRKRHQSRVRIYNLCSERGYDASVFEGIGDVACFPFDDHNPCKFDMIHAFCTDLSSWLAAHPQNVAAIHCKAGKGRTGLMLCCFLLHQGMPFGSDPDEILSQYGNIRTKNGKGVTIPSQQRYVRYYAEYLAALKVQAEPLPEGSKTEEKLGEQKEDGNQQPGLVEEEIKPVRIPLDAIATLATPAAIHARALQLCEEAPVRNLLSIRYKGLTEPGWLVVECADTDVKVNSLTNEQIRSAVDFQQQTVDFDFTPLLQLKNDVHIKAFRQNKFRSTKKVFHFWFNTKFLKPSANNPNSFSLTLKKNQLDGAHKDCKKNKKFSANLQGSFLHSFLFRKFLILSVIFLQIAPNSP